MSRSPYLIDGPTCFSLSGGRTSAFMLHKTIQENNGFPKEALAIFCNTGKEDLRTLGFVHEIETNWNVPVVWLEYRFSKNAPVQSVNQAIARSIDPIYESIFTVEKQFEIVTYETASRNGEPFEQIIAQRDGALPNPRSRYCSSEMKTRTMHRYLRSIGWTEWDTFIGIRADEPKRVAKFRLNPHPETKAETVRLPLAQEGISALDVGQFWEAQPFDLQLKNIGGKAPDGNCDLCFLKPRRQIFSLIAEKPERAIWWASQEHQAEYRADGNGRRFRIDRPSYQQMAKYAEQQQDMFDPDEESIACFCGD